jgi:hypothetical protein
VLLLERYVQHKPLTTTRSLLAAACPHPPPFLCLCVDSSSGASAQDPAGDDESSGPAYDPAELTKGAPSRHLWLGNLHQRLPRSLLRSTFERFGPVEDVVTFPGRMYAFVNFREPADAAKAAQAVQVRVTGCRALQGRYSSGQRPALVVAQGCVRCRVTTHAQNSMALCA